MSLLGLRRKYRSKTAFLLNQYFVPVIVIYYIFFPDTLYRSLQCKSRHYISKTCEKVFGTHDFAHVISTGNFFTLLAFDGDRRHNIMDHYIRDSSTDMNLFQYDQLYQKWLYSCFEANHQIIQPNMPVNTIVEIF